MIRLTIMNDFNTWHDKQPKTISNRFKPQWTVDTVLWIIKELNQMTNYADLQYQLVKDYNISMASAGLWIEMSRRVMKDMNNGLSLEDAIKRDKERRNQRRRMNKDMYKKQLTEEEVIEIREKSKDHSQVQIAEEYGIGKSTVSSIINRTRWKTI